MLDSFLSGLVGTVLLRIGQLLTLVWVLSLFTWTYGVLAFAFTAGGMYLRYVSRQTVRVRDTRFLR